MIPFAFEAIVTDPAPDDAAPGNIRVRIPELFGDSEVPLDIAPLFPGWTAGGWQSVPGSTTPENTETRVIVIRVGPSSYRWIGTSQPWSTVTDAPGTIAGARSGDGKHWIILDNAKGVIIAVDTTSAKQIYLGSDAATQHALLGEQLKTLLQSVMTLLDAHVHIGNLGAPTSPPTIPMKPTFDAGIDATFSTKVRLE